LDDLFYDFYLTTITISLKVSDISQTDLCS
jgi:hypothetical protein